MNYLKVKEGPPLHIGADEKIDLRNPGVERFVTLPLDQTEGLDSRREFTLPQSNLDWIPETGLRTNLLWRKMCFAWCCIDSNFLRAIYTAKPI